jgi:acetyl-CoA acetyltransferase
VDHIYIAGIAMTVFGRHPERSLHDLAGEALQGALRDAGCSAADVGVAYYAGITNGPPQGQISIPGQVVFSKIGIEGIPVYNVENACASGSSALNLAVQSLRAGTTDVALALGAEKMNIPDKAKSFAIFEGGWDVSRVEENYQTLVKMGDGITPPPGSESDRPYSKFMAIYAAICRWHMKTYGTTQRQIAAVCAKNHQHSVHNPWSQFRKPFTVPHGPATALQVTALLLLGDHVIELLIAFAAVRRHPGPLIDSIVLTLLFGFLHWQPLRRPPPAK